MDINIEKTIQTIKHLPTVPSVNEWNRIAKEQNLVSSSTLKAIYGGAFYKICSQIRREK